MHPSIPAPHRLSHSEHVRDGAALEDAHVVQRVPVGVIQVVSEVVVSATVADLGNGWEGQGAMPNDGD